MLDYATTQSQITDLAASSFVMTQNFETSDDESPKVTTSNKIVTYAAIGGSVGFVVLTSLIVTIVVVSKKSRRHDSIELDLARKGDPSNREYEPIGSKHVTLTVPSVRGLVRSPESEIDFNELEFGEQIGVGGY